MSKSKPGTVEFIINGLPTGMGPKPLRCRCNALTAKPLELADKSKRNRPIALWAKF